MRSLIAFPCAGATLMATLDDAPGGTGVLIVSGGNEIRIGPHRGMAMLAASLAAQGLPVFRFDRRGIGDSEGENQGWASAAPDLVAAAAAFRAAQPQLTRIVGLGNCDAATTLALFGRDAGIDHLVLTNPWLREESDELPPSAAIRSRYAQRLRDPATWLRLLRGDIDLRKLAGGLRKLARPSHADSLPRQMLTAIERWGEAATVLLAEGDATAIAFGAEAKGCAVRIETVPTASHSFVGHAAALEAAILRAAR